MLAAIEEHAWDGDWYLRAYDAAGEPVGSHTCDEGQIFVESQGWCVLGGAGRDNGRARRALESVHERLFTEHGIVLQQPAYSHYRVELGEITSYPPGYKENAGVFCHNNTWIQLAWCLLGEGDRAFEYYLSTCPSAQEERIETYRSEPYVYAQMIAGPDAATPGEAKNSWLTGTAAWTFVTISQGILGIKPDLRRAANRPVRPLLLAGIPRPAPLPRRRLRHLGREPGRRLQRHPLAPRGRERDRREPRPARARRRAGRGRGRTRKRRSGAACARRRGRCIPVSLRAARVRRGVVCPGGSMCPSVEHWLREY